MLKIVSSERKEPATSKLQEIPFNRLKHRYSPDDLNGAIMSAARSAEKYDFSYYVYPGNSYGSFCWRVDYKKEHALDPINNSGGKLYEVTKNREIIQHILGKA